MTAGVAAIIAVAAVPQPEILKPKLYLPQSYTPEIRPSDGFTYAERNIQRFTTFSDGFQDFFVFLFYRIDTVLFPLSLQS